YREVGTLAGAGTAVQIGDKVSEAEAWPEISAPPYFVAYRGFYVEGMETGLLLPGKESWRVTSAPTDLTEGAQWVLTEEHGRVRKLRITSRRGDNVTIAEVETQTCCAPALNLSAAITPAELALQSVTFTSGAHAMRIAFKPDLNLAAMSSGTGSSQFSFQIDLDRHEKLSQGTITGEKHGD